MGNCLPKPQKKKRAEPARSRREKENIDEILSKSLKCQKPYQNEPVDMAKALNVEETNENNAAPDCPQTINKAVAFTVELGAETPKNDSPDSPACSKKATTFIVDLSDKKPHNILPESPVCAKKALAFTADIKDEKPKTRVPTQISDKAVKGREAPSEIVYTNDEESLMDEILMDMEGTKSENNKEQDAKKKYTLDEKTLMAEIMREDRLKEIKDKARQEEVKIHDARRRRMNTEKSRDAKVDNKPTRSAPGVDVQRKKVRDLAKEDRWKAAESRRRRSHRGKGGAGRGGIALGIGWVGWRRLYREGFDWVQTEVGDMPFLSVIMFCCIILIVKLLFYT